MNIKISIVLLLALQVSCEYAPKIIHDYKKPDVVEITNQKHVNESFDTIWYRLVKNLTKSFFSINHIDKQSRVISLNFSITNPNDLFICGHSTIYYKDIKSKCETYIFNDADDSRYRKLFDSNDLFRPLTTRKMSLNGVINYYLEPVDDGTNIIVNVRYVIKKDESFYYNSGSGYGYERNMTDFCTMNTGSFCIMDYMTCRPTGKFEHELLTYCEENPSNYKYELYKPDKPNKLDREDMDICKEKLDISSQSRR